MKKTILIFFVLLASSLLFADDVIILRSSVRIDGKIESISNTELRYKKANNLTGPTYITPLADVSLIILEDGEVLSYADIEDTTQTTNKNTKSVKKENPTPTESPNSTPKNKRVRNLTPSDRTLMGVSVGYALKQTEFDYYGDGSDYYNCYRYVVIPTCQIGYILQPEFKYGLGIKTGVNLEIGEASHYYSNHSLLEIGMNFPLQCSYRCEWLKGFSTLIYTGPIFDFGMLMKIKVGAQPYSNAYNHYSDSGFNCLWGFGLAAQYNHWRFAFDAGVGMVGRKTGSGSGGSMIEWGLMHKPMTLSIAYMFNRKKDN